MYRETDERCEEVGERISKGVGGDWEARPRMMSDCRVSLSSSMPCANCVNKSVT